jgi:hypothetical protein
MTEVVKLINKIVLPLKMPVQETNLTDVITELVLLMKLIVN